MIQLKRHTRFLKLWLLLAIFFLCVSFSIAQPPLPAHNNYTTIASDCDAKVVTALTLTEAHSMHFGTMTIPTGAVNVMLTTGTIVTASIPAFISLLAQSPVPANAIYSVSGSPASTYAITLPGDNLVTISNGTSQVHIDNFVARALSSGLDGLTGTLDGSGNDSFVVGATLKLLNAQPFGDYTGTFNVTVNYN